jgi:hypothetical protein
MTNIPGGAIRSGAPRRQRGIATILIVLLVGLSLGAAVLGATAYLRSTQDQSLTLHGQVQAQMKAWSGEEIVRQYLATLQTNGNLPVLASAISTASGNKLPITTGVTGITANFTGVNSTTNPTLVTATIEGQTAIGSTKAQSSSTLQVAYGISTAAAATTSVLNFNRNLVLGGGINVVGSNTTNGSYTINVNGDVSTGGNSITGVSTINSTGSINIGSGSSFTQLNSNCDVSISGSVTAVTINALRNICMTGGAAVPGTALANGSISAQSTFSQNGVLSSLAASTAPSSCQASGTSGSGTIAATCPVPAISGVDLSAGGAGAQTVNTDGSVLLGAGGKIGTLNAVGNLTASSGATVTTGTVGGTVTKATGSTTVNVNVVKGNTVSIAPATSVSISTSTFNAYDLQSVANYAFTVNSSGYIIVTVQNINGVANGAYYLGTYGSGNVDYLCATLTSSSTASAPVCQTPALSSGVKICQGYSAYNSCFSYSNGSWTINGTSMAPGIAWFQGNLNLGSGTYYGTFIATGNIATSGQNVTYALNYAGYSGTVAGVQYAPTGICTNSYFPNLYPTQFCTTSTQTYNASADGGVGNFAFMAGSWTGTYTGLSSYVGGNISLGASSVIHGNVKAGNEFTSGGSTTVNGAITALALGAAVENSMGGSTTINLSNLPPTFTVTDGSNGGGTPSSNSIKIQWVRYL